MDSSHYEPDAQARLVGVLMCPFAIAAGHPAIARLCRLPGHLYHRCYHIASAADVGSAQCRGSGDR